MPVPSRIATAAQSYKQNAKFLKQTIDGMSDEDWVHRPNDHTNHLLWIVGHMAWARSALLGRLGSPWSKPWMPQYARGGKCVDTSDCPSHSEVMEAWDESCTRLNEVLEAASEEILETPYGPPSPDGKISGMVNFLAFHETYHVGQTAYLRSFLGHANVMG